MPRVLPSLAITDTEPSDFDHRDWSAGICGTTFGVRVGIRVDNSDLIAKINEHLPCDWRESHSPVVDYLYSIRAGGSGRGSGIGKLFIGYRGACPFVHTVDETEALYALEHALYSDIVCAQTPYSFVHAGVVGWKDRAIVLPGASGTGKSQLVLALLRAGAIFYSDDIAPIDDSGAVYPAPRAIGVRDDCGMRRAISAQALGAKTGGQRLPIGLVVSTRHEHGAEWNPRAGSAGEALLALLAHTGTTRTAPAQSMHRLARAVDAAAFLEGPRGEADMMAPSLLRALEESE